MSFLSRGVGVSLSALASCLLPLAALAQTPALINYQGRLLNGTNLVNGSVGLSLRLFDASAAGTLLYEDSNSVAVTDSLYATLIGDNTTFGNLQSALESTNVWIEVAVNDNALTPRERLVSAAYAVKAQQAQVFTGSVLDTQLSANIARLNGTNQTFAGPVAFTSVSNTFIGTFSGSGAGITNVSIESLTADQPRIIAWGDNGSGRATVPAGATGAVAIAGGAAHSLALRSDGTVLAWGSNNNGQTNVPASATGVTAIAAGGHHNLALRADGTVVAWGLGTNDLNNQSAEGQSIVPATATNVVAVAAGGIVSLALRADGTVVPWGYSVSGPPIAPATATNVVAIACGYWHNLALRSNGTVVAWGQGGLGQSTVPATATGVVAIAAGGYHSLALRSDGTVIAWGAGTNDLDTGIHEGQSIVPAGATGVVAIAGGEVHSLALRSDGTVLAWGKNNAGQASVPVTATGVTAIASGWSHNLARQTVTGPARLARLDVAANVFAGTVSASAFAGNGAALTGITGSGIADGTISTADLSSSVLTNISARLDSDVWAAADSTTNYVRRTGDAMTGVLTNPAGFVGPFAGDGTGITNIGLASIDLGQPPVLAWGNNSYGQTNVPAGATGVVALAGGEYHSLALRDDGTVLAWGRNSNGQASVPVTATGVVAIAAGSDHSLALRGDGIVVAWGAGTNDLNDSLNEGQSIVPANATGVVAISGGEFHTLALRGDGRVIAWGAGTNESYLAPNFSQSLVPFTATGVVAIAAGRIHSLALRSNGTVIAWGANFNGQTNVPVSATGVVAIAVGYYHNLALRGNGTVIAWGANNEGQATVPAGTTGVVAIAAGGDHSLALRGDGTVIAWGANYAGQATVPAGAKGVVAIAAGSRHSLVLRSAVVLARLDAETNAFAGTVSAGAFAGNGAGLTNVGTSSLAVDVLTNISARLSSNVWAAAQTNLAVRSGTNLFAGVNTFTGTLTVTGTLLGSPPYIKVVETQPKGIDAGANNATTNNFRDLNAELVDTHSLATLSGGNLTLPAGTYQCRISAPAYRVDEHQIRLRLVNGATLLYGTSEFSDDALSPGVQSRSWIDGQFTLASTSTLTVQHFTALIKTGNGLGLAANAAWTDSAPAEVYTVAEFWKIK